LPLRRSQSIPQGIDEAIARLRVSRHLQQLLLLIYYDYYC
jgi:hypothetical protein